jgi:RNA 2',3'-cyclic 3'-phosphodiesterase
MGPMQLYAAVIPPDHALAELADLVRSVAPGTPQLDPVPAHEMLLPITNFGNVAQRDAVAMVSALAEEAKGWSTGRLHFAGGAALEWRGDENVWAKAGGDVDALNTVGRGVPPVVQRLGFFVDRRAFRPLLAVGRITDATTAPYLEKLVAELDAFHGTEWAMEEVLVMRRLPADPSAPGPAAEVFERLALAAG